MEDQAWDWIWVAIVYVLRFADAQHALKHMQVHLGPFAGPGASAPTLSNHKHEPACLGAMQPDKQQASGSGARLVASYASLQELVATKSSAKLCNQFLLVLVALLVLGRAATSKAHTSSQSLLLFPAIALLTLI